MKPSRMSARNSKDLLDDGRRHKTMIIWMTAMIFHDEECWYSMISSQQMQYERALWACAQKGNDRKKE